MISQRRGKCRGKSENTPGSSKETPSSLEFPRLSQVGTPNFKTLQILALARRPNVLLPMSQPSIHRRTGNFRPGGAVNHLPKKFLQVAQIFTKHSKRNEGHTMQQHRPYWHMKVPRYSFSGSIPAKFEHKLRCHKQTFGKIATTVVLNKDENLS